MIHPQSSTDASQAATLTHALSLLRAGELVGMPTETVYGLAADARNPEAIAKIFALKGRPNNHPLIVHLQSAEHMRDWASQVSAQAWALATAFWPGPMTLILPKAPGVLDAVTGAQDSIGLRVPAHPIAQALLKQFGDGLAAPSANRFGRISPTSAAHVREEFGTDLACVLDGGDSQIGLESTIIDARGSQLKVLRPGAIQIAQLQAFDVSAEYAQPSNLRVSGNLASHYAPQTTARLVTRSELTERRFGFAGLSIGALPGHTFGIALSEQPADYARELYAALRELDAQRPKEIWIESPPDQEDWRAIRDRLTRACA